jgi:hypothetical protein
MSVEFENQVTRIPFGRGQAAEKGLIGASAKQENRRQMASIGPNRSESESSMFFKGERLREIHAIRSESGRKGKRLPRKNAKNTRAGRYTACLLCDPCTAIRQIHSLSRRFGSGMLGKGITQDIVLSRFPCPTFPCPFSPFQKQDGSQKNGGKKISWSYIFASIFLPCIVPSAIRFRERAG